MIDHQSRCIYVHIPKTGGNSINRVFGVNWANHKDLARYARELDPEVFQSYCKFAIVRNPWDRILSEYNYQKKKSRPDATRLYIFKEDGTRRNFREWLAAVFAQPDRYPDSQWGGEVSPGIHRFSPQLDWISLGGGIGVDRVLRLETLQPEFDRLRRELGLPLARLACRNRKFHWHYSRYYDDTTRQMVAAYYARDIQAFGYTFERRWPAWLGNWPGWTSLAWRGKLKTA